VRVCVRGCALSFLYGLPTQSASIVRAPAHGPSRRCVCMFAWGCVCAWVDVCVRGWMCVCVGGCVCAWVDVCVRGWMCVCVCLLQARADFEAGRLTAGPINEQYAKEREEV
jgi:hypothetical protein